MSNDLLARLREIEDRSKGVTASNCFICQAPLPPKALFCPNCGPPAPAEEDPEEGISFGQAFARIFLLVLLFGVIAVYKLDISVTQMIKETFTGTQPVPAATETLEEEEPDFKTIYVVNVSAANVRDKGSMEGSKILFVLERGSEVEILERGEEWSKIKIGEGSGFIANSLLVAKIQ